MFQRQTITQIKRYLHISSRPLVMSQISRKGFRPDHPTPQPYYTYDNIKQAWEQADINPSSETHGGKGITRLSLFSWNIDFRIPFAKERMNTALDHLESLTEKQPSTTTSVIYLQECIAQDLRTIGEKPWVREKFYLTDINTSNWADDYGTVTLVDRRLRITSCFRVHYEKTRMGRDAFFVDVLLDGSSSSSGRAKTIRLCNSHLDSLDFEPPFRPAQVQIMAKYMHEDGVDGALAAGDFNAIQPFDRTLHSDNGLKDAYLESGGMEDGDDAYTWGQQASTEERDKYGLSRMDKVYFTGDLKLHNFERFGMDVQLDEKILEAECEYLVSSYGYEKPWITDHLGVMAEMEVVD
ncbi:Endonuclease/exonuclease/phosphatase [Annulohypoxylon truncatum]|uniref:Endonuclease/exonuclease/phosphatase n=1 Tax=Annulohypoxylon truncatum TaxID=327061 RepID=UPI0020082168|nr:Endonuclease/exonuclease/phosphatase [Annulohypoxylon truncatum]KAI1213395.1 Endonuclease/exonuclease/phosphatase [Annulohypoxylon truncatum]